MKKSLKKNNLLLIVIFIILFIFPLTPLSQKPSNLAPGSILNDGSYMDKNVLLTIRLNLKNYFSILEKSKKNSIEHPLFSEALVLKNKVARKMATQQVYYSTNEESEEIQEFIKSIKNNAKDEKEEGFMVAVSSGGIELSMAINGSAEKMIIMDINPLVIDTYFPLLISLICSSKNRQDFLCNLTGRNYLNLSEKRKKQGLKKGMNTLKSLLNNIKKNEADMAKTQQKISSFFPATNKSNLDSAQQMLAHIHQREQNQIKRLINKMNFEESWLYSEENYQKTKKFLLAGNLTGCHIDLAKEFPKELKNWLSAQGPVKSLYFSNLMDYFRSNQQITSFIKNTLFLSSLKGKLQMPLFFGSQLKHTLWGPWNKTLKEWLDIAS